MDRCRNQGERGEVGEGIGKSSAPSPSHTQYLLLWDSICIARLIMNLCHYFWMNLPLLLNVPDLPLISSLVLCFFMANFSTDNMFTCMLLSAICKLIIYIWCPHFQAPTQLPVC